MIINFVSMINYIIRLEKVDRVLWKRVVIRFINELLGIIVGNSEEYLNINL